MAQSRSLAGLASQRAFVPVRFHVKCNKARDTKTWERPSPDITPQIREQNTLRTMFTSKTLNWYLFIYFGCDWQFTDDLLRRGGDDFWLVMLSLTPNVTELPRKSASVLLRAHACHDRIRITILGNTPVTGKQPWWGQSNQPPSTWNGRKRGLGWTRLVSVLDESWAKWAGDKVQVTRSVVFGFL